MEDNGFVTGLFNIKVVSQDGEINTTYHDYLKKHQKRSIWSYPGKWIKSLFKTKEKTAKGGEGKFDPYYLSESENNIAEAIRANIIFSFNEKTGVISIKAKAQDPLICKTLADSVTFHLQDFITQYRTNKARVDYDYYKHIAAKAKSDYEKVRQSYASMSDASTHISLRSAEMKLEDMENDMQLKFNAYSTINTQLEAAKAKVQERTPAFTMLKGASVPIKPAGPKRMLFVIFMLAVATLATTTYILRGDILKIIELREKK
jgi:LPS O-antigen subunit length determinant protein (WzzB/FepE family)